MSIYFTDVYKEVIENGNSEAFIEQFGKEIHNNGTEALIQYEDVKTGTSFQLRLDVLDDLKTPYFHVRGDSDDIYLEIFDTFEAAYEDFNRVVEAHKAKLEDVDTVPSKLKEIEETRTDDETASNETTIYTYQLEWLLEQAIKVTRFEKALRQISDTIGEDATTKMRSIATNALSEGKQ